MQDMREKVVADERWKEQVRRKNSQSAQVASEPSFETQESSVLTLTNAVVQTWSPMSPEEAYGFLTAKPRPCLEGTLV